ncbi:MAG: AmmeMemoRadiSam system protein A, partial [Ignavibacteriales bacterium]
LLLAARESILSLFGGMGPSEVNYSIHPNLQEKAGAFVTLTIKGSLRGCIGYIFSPMTLFDTVISAAKQAAMHDPRFTPLAEEEVDKISIEVSVLTPPEPLKSYSDIKIGVHGLLLEESEHRAVLLPQVATEHNFDVNQFLSALCDKAWLPPGTWRERQLPLKVFTSIVFSESGKRKITYVPD